MGEIMWISLIFILFSLAMAQYQVPPVATAAASVPFRPQYGAAPPQFNPYQYLSRSIYDPVINHVCTDDTNFSFTPASHWDKDYSSEHHRRHRRIHRVTCTRLTIKYESHCTRCCRIAAQPVPGVSPLVVKGMILTHKHDDGREGKKCVCCAPELPPDQTYYQNSLVQPQNNYQSAY